MKVRISIKTPLIAAEQMSNAFSGIFDTLSVAPGTILKAGNVAAHTASTTKGASGSPAVVGSAFGGIHISAAFQYESDIKDKFRSYEDRNYNLMLSVGHPIFKQEYERIVYPALKSANLSNAQNQLLKTFLNKP